MFHLRTLGGLDLRDAEERKVTAVLAHPKRAALLVYLMVNAGAARRDTLIALFWPESPQDLARSSLRKALHYLRQALGEESIVSSEDDEVSVAPGRISCDAREVEDADAATAHALYRGAFLEGFHLSDAPEFERWVERERVRLRERVCDIMWRKAESEGELGNAYDAAHWARNALGIVPDDEARLRKLLLLLERLGDRAGAISAYEDFARRLSQDLGVAVSSETQALATRIRDARQQPAERVKPKESLGDVQASLPVTPRSADASFWKRRSSRLAAALVLVSVIAVASLRLYDAVASPPPAAATAVLPFAFRGSPELSYLAAGMPMLLATSLDGAGMQTTDSASARYHVAGEMVEAGGRVRISVDMRDVQERKSIAKGSVEDSSSRIFALVDQLAAQLVAAGPAARRERLTQLASATTSSLPALRAYLEGESHFRIGHYKEAVDAYQRAIGEDTAFALAHYRLAVAYGWSSDTLARPTARRAVQLAHRLSHTERTMMEAYRAYSHGDADNAERLYREIVRLRPFDGDAWYHLGEVLFHFNSIRGRPILEARPMFVRALANGPKDATITHLLEIEAIDGSYAPYDSLLGEISPGAHFDLVGRTVRALARGSAADKARLLQENSRASDGDLANYARHALFLIEDREGAASLVRLLLSPGRPAEARALGHILLAHLEAAAGRLRSAEAQLRKAAELDPTRTLEHRGLIESLPFLPTTLAQRLTSRDALLKWRADAAPSGIVFSDDRFMHDHMRNYVVGMLSLRAGDTASAVRAAKALVNSATDSQPFAIMLARGIKAQLLMLQGKHQEALDSISKSHTQPTVADLIGIVPFVGLGSERFLRAELLRELDRKEEAISWYASFGQHSAYDRIFLAPAHRRMAELHESAGRTNEAVAHYEKFVRLWKDSDEELQPIVAEARARIAALRG